MIDIKAITKKIRDAVYGLDVRESIAQGLDAIHDNEEEHKRETEQKINNYKADTDNKIEAQNGRIDEVLEKYEQVITSGGDSVLEIVDARVPFNTLKQKLDDIEEKSLNVKDISLGAVSSEENRTLKVYNGEGEMVAIIDKDNTSFANMEIANLTCENVITKQRGITLYVNGDNGDDGNDGLTSSTAFKTISRAIDYLNKYLEANVNIHVAKATYNEKIMFEGFQGLGSISLNLSSETVINGEICVNSCTTTVKILGDSATPAVLNHTTARQSAISVHTSPYCIVQYLIINGNSNTKYCAEANIGGGLAIKTCTLNNSASSALVAFECSKMYIVNCVGQNHKGYSVQSASGSVISLFGTIPYSSTENWSTTGIIHGTATKDSGTGASETPIVATTKTYSAIKQVAYRAVDGWKTQVFQGQYDPNNPNTYNYTGVYVLDSAKMRTELAGKSIKSVKMTVQRYFEGQGIGQPVAVSLNFWGTTSTGSGSKPVLNKKYATINNVAKNQKISVSLPIAFISDVLNNNINSIALYTADGSHYCRMASAFSLEVSYV